ncbi:MAG: CYTH domain-containing protein [Ruminococcaceae bacterium]|nr:CYTH domain-containing protein [Oscillospiraceae bacterium]
METTVSKIVITGGPCAGKSTAMSRIQSVFTQMGYLVLFVPETATELITGGITPFLTTNIDFQKKLAALQLTKEQIYMDAARSATVEKVLVVCDRGIEDAKAYMDASEFEEVLKALKKSEVELRDNYDAVFHLVSAAKGAQAFYTTANNLARKESIEQAAAIDDKLIAAWAGHPHLRVIDNATDFDDKIKRLIEEISAFLGEPEPLEIERKFLIEYPDIPALEKMPNCRKVEIIQTYLSCNDEEEIRVRQRGENGKYIYFQTIKKRVSGLKRIEIERRLSQQEYLTLLMQADTSMHQIRKDRYCLMFKNQYFEIDIYPFWNDKAICEIELKNENDEVCFPQFIKVIKEVTEDSAYKNASLAKR